LTGVATTALLFAAANNNRHSNALAEKKSPAATAASPAPAPVTAPATSTMAPSAAVTTASLSADDSDDIGPPPPQSVNSDRLDDATVKWILKQIRFDPSTDPKDYEIRIRSLLAMNFACPCMQKQMKGPCADQYFRYVLH
jgi:hypothetical protein